MKLAILNDIPFVKYHGGTEYYCEFLKRAAIDKGYEAEIFNADKCHPSHLKECSAAIVTNVSHFPESTLRYLIKHTPYLKIEMDYGFCSMRNHLCGMCKDGKAVIEEKKPCPNIPSIYKDLLENARPIVFLNPHQREVYRHHFGDVVNNSFVAIPFYDYPEAYTDQGRFRLPKSFLFTHRLFQEKGVMEAIQIATQVPDGHFFFLGFGEQKYLALLNNLKNVHYLGMENDRAKMREYMNMFEHFISVPLWKDTGPVSLLEAELCGMKLIVNENNTIRTNNWKDKEELIKMINEAREAIFQAVGQLTS